MILPDHLFGLNFSTVLPLTKNVKYFIDYLSRMQYNTLHMVDRYPDEPHGEGSEPFFADFEFQRQWGRMEKLAVAHSFLARAFDLDKKLTESGVTKKFVSRSTGDVAGGRYPFFHLRVKLKPKNRVDTDILVAALRFPSTIGFHEVTADKLYVAYEDAEGEHLFYLSADQYSRLDPHRAFRQPGEGSVFPPDPDGLSAVTDMELLALESILGVESVFEPDLQQNKPDITA